MQKQKISPVDYKILQIVKSPDLHKYEPRTFAEEIAHSGRLTEQLKVFKLKPRRLEVRQ